MVKGSTKKNNPRKRGLMGAFLTILFLVEKEDMHSELVGSFGIIFGFKHAFNIGIVEDSLTIGTKAANHVTTVKGVELWLCPTTVLKKGDRVIS